MQRGCTGRRQKHCKTFASSNAPVRGRKGGVAMSKARIIFILTTVVLVAAQVAIMRPCGMYDGN